MNLIDTHCHLHEPEYFPDPAKIIEEANQSDITQIITISTDNQDSQTARNFASKHQNIFYTFGVHPNIENKTFTPPKPHKKLVAIGEVGLDYHYTREDKAAQIALLHQMFELAHALNLPMVFHIREPEAFDDFWPIYDQYRPRGVIHSFSDNEENLQKALKRNLYIGVNGLITFAKNIPLPPLENILLETDAPYLAPAPYRGKQNSPKYIKTIAKYLSHKLDQPLDKIAETTTKNAQNLFGLC